MNHWVYRRIFTFLLACLMGLCIGSLLAYFFTWRLPICILVCIILAQSMLWFLDLKNASIMMHWLYDKNAPANLDEKYYPTGLWSELSRYTMHVLRERDRKIADQHHQLQQILSALQIAPVGLILLDQHNRLIWGNNSASYYLDLIFPKDYGQHIINLVRQPEFIKLFEILPSNEKTETLKMQWGQEYQNTLSVILTSYNDQHEKLMILQDITEHERSDQMRRDFVANVSHEIRTPLTVLIGFIETIQSLPLSKSESDHYLQLMGEQSFRMQSLINDLLTLAKLEGSPPPDINTWVSVADLMGKVERTALQLSEKNHQIRVEMDAPEHIQIAGDETELLSAFVNLVANAVRYTPSNSHIEIHWVTEVDGSGAFYVEDDGPGISKEHLDRLSERFYRIDRSRSRQTGGTGLGLSIVKHVMQRHGGTLSIESDLGRGAKFILRFPGARLKNKTT